MTIELTQAIALALPLLAGLVSVGVGAHQVRRLRLVTGNDGLVARLLSLEPRRLTAPVVSAPPPVETAAEAAGASYSK